MKFQKFEPKNCIKMELNSILELEGKTSTKLLYETIKTLYVLLLFVGGESVVQLLGDEFEPRLVDFGETSLSIGG